MGWNYQEDDSVKVCFIVCFWFEMKTEQVNRSEPISSMISYSGYELNPDFWALQKEWSVCRSLQKFYRLVATAGTPPSRGWKIDVELA